MIPGAAFFVTVELTFFAANLPKVMSGGWLPLAVGSVFFTILTTWRRGRMLLARALREGRVSTRRFLNRMIDDPPLRVPGTAVFLTGSPETAPTALLKNAEHNHVVHEQVILLKLETLAVPHLDASQRIVLEPLRLGFVVVTARYGYQDEPNAMEALEAARAQGLDVDLDRASFYVDHVSVLPTGRWRMAGWRKRLFALLHQNSAPAARAYGIPPDRVFEVGGFVEL